MWLTTDEFNFLPILAPIDMATGAAISTNIIQMQNYDSAVIGIHCGLLANDGVWYLKEYTAKATSSQVMPAVAYYRLSGGAAGSTADTLGTRTSVASSGIAITNGTHDGLTYYVEVKSADLDAGYTGVGIYFPVISTGALMSATAVMKPKYLQKTMISATVVS